MPTPSGRHSWLLRRQSGGSRAIFASMGISLNVPNERISGSQDVVVAVCPGAVRLTARENVPYLRWPPEAGVSAAARV
jgi:hypothetical protein